MEYVPDNYDVWETHDWEQGQARKEEYEPEFDWGEEVIE